MPQDIGTLSFTSDVWSSPHVESNNPEGQLNLTLISTTAEIIMFQAWSILGYYEDKPLI